MNSVPSLGAEGDVVSVSDGYARNFLLPRGLAAPVTKASQNRLARLQEEREASRRDEIAAAKQKAKRLKGVSPSVLHVLSTFRMHQWFRLNHTIACIPQKICYRQLV